MGLIESFLERVAIIQKKYTGTLIIIVLLITAFMLVGAFKLRMESDLSKMNPQGLEVFQLNDRITSKFGGQDTILILIGIDKNSNSKYVISDIRDARVINYIMQLEDSLNAESSVSSVTSIANIYSGMESVSDDTIRYTLEQYPELNDFFSDNYAYTFLIVRSDIGEAEDKTIAITTLIQEKIDEFPKPPGTEVLITGSPPIRVTILDVLKHDAAYTLILAFIIIFILLIIMEQSLMKAALISAPLILGLIWTMGTMGHLGLELSIVTAGLGAMLLGLGVEYGVFMLKRYEEERDKGKDQLASLKVSLPSVGTSIMASGLTTVVGFLALTLSFSPMLQKLGLSLALGIFYCLITALVVSPLIFMTAENMEDKLELKLDRIFKRRYSKRHDISDFDKTDSSAESRSKK
ncbi:MAG: efflux RND transporter permease subunit [Candidatus Woesearchaeota archaeon]